MAHGQLLTQIELVVAAQKCGADLVGKVQRDHEDPEIQLHFIGIPVNYYIVYWFSRPFRDGQPLTRFYRPDSKENYHGKVYRGAKLQACIARNIFNWID